MPTLLTTQGHTYHGDNNYSRPILAIYPKQQYLDLLAALLCLHKTEHHQLKSLLQWWGYLAHICSLKKHRIWRSILTTQTAKDGSSYNLLSTCIKCVVCLLMSKNSLISSATFWSFSLDLLMSTTFSPWLASWNIKDKKIHKGVTMHNYNSN